MTVTFAKPSGLGMKDAGPKVPRDGRDRPLVVPLGGGKPKAHTRVTTFVDCIEDKSNLATWGERMVLVGVSKQPTMLNAVYGLDPEDGQDKRKLNGLAERAKVLAGANEKREQGTRHHELSEFVDRGEQLPACTESELADMASYKMATVDLDILHIERLVVVEDTESAGTPDRVSFYAGLTPDGKPAGNLITDLKTGSVEYGALKMAMQLASYSRGKLYDPSLFPAPDREQDEKAWQKWKNTVVSPEEAAAAYTALPDVNQDWGLIIHLPAGSGVCTVYWIDLATGWEAVQVAKQVRAIRSKKKVMFPFESDVRQVTPLQVAHA